MDVSYNSGTRQFTFSRPPVSGSAVFRRSVQEVNGVWQWVEEFPQYPQTFKVLSQSGSTVSTLQNIVGTLAFDTEQQSLNSGVSIYAGTRVLS